MINIGLCGTYDGDQGNEFLSGDGVAMDTVGVTEWRGSKINTGFVNSWRYVWLVHLCFT